MCILPGDLSKASRRHQVLAAGIPGIFSESAEVGEIQKCRSCVYPFLLDSLKEPSDSTHLKLQLEVRLTPPKRMTPPKRDTFSTFGGDQNRQNSQTPEISQSPEINRKLTLQLLEASSQV